MCGSLLCGVAVRAVRVSGASRARCVSRGGGGGGGGRPPPTRAPLSSVLRAPPCSVLCALCFSVLCAPCSMLRAPCSVLCAPCSVLRALCSVLRALCGTVLLSILRGVWPGRRGTVLYLCTFEPQPRYTPPWFVNDSSVGLAGCSKCRWERCEKCSIGNAYNYIIRHATTPSWWGKRKHCYLQQ